MNSLTTGEKKKDLETINRESRTWIQTWQMQSMHLPNVDSRTSLLGRALSDCGCKSPLEIVQHCTIIKRTELDQFGEGQEACNFLDHFSMKLVQRLYFIPCGGMTPTISGTSLELNMCVFILGSKRSLPETQSGSVSSPHSYTEHDLFTVLIFTSTSYRTSAGRMALIRARVGKLAPHRVWHFSHNTWCFVFRLSSKYQCQCETPRPGLLGVGGGSKSFCFANPEP